jgi:hypothetical protein
LTVGVVAWYLIQVNVSGGDNPPGISWLGALAAGRAAQAHHEIDWRLPVGIVGGGRHAQAWRLSRAIS